MPSSSNSSGRARANDVTDALTKKQKRRRSAESVGLIETREPGEDRHAGVPGVRALRWLL
ncbi:hypothetical protein AYO39_01835 [Actinobacteria bacterium SCGC AG-212-D09]|nr:hypothetical protein AYO39_01835 [Actinobacteria bacterium SCGC AG-212-D09]